MSSVRKKSFFALFFVLVWAAVAEYHRLGVLNNSVLFLTVLHAGKSKGITMVGFVDGHFLVVSFYGRERLSLPVSTYKGTNPINKGSQRPHLQISY